MPIRRKTKLWAFLLLLLGVAGRGYAQIDTATVAGRVVDRTGATIPRAQITVTNTGTNSHTTRRVMTMASGPSARCISACTS